MFLPTTRAELKDLGWKELDVILVTGDTYIDSPNIGTAVIGKYLVSQGFRVGIIAQPAVDGDKDITRLGEPKLFWGVSGGSVDSMVANYTASNKRRREDDFTPGGINNRRPDRAVFAYSNLIRRFFKNTRPIVLGGIEASLRRIAHYDFWDNKVRRSILFDAKADILVYGMGERAVLSIAQNLRDGTDLKNVPGICYISRECSAEYIRLPAYEDVSGDQEQFTRMFHLFYQNNDFQTAKGLCQKHADRYLVQNPPSEPLGEGELDDLYELDFERDVHPYYKKDGSVRAMDTIRFSITTHRGCYGECHFCAITMHQGRSVQSRSIDSICREAESYRHHPEYKGIIQDVGGPTANMYGTSCRKGPGHCKARRCLYPNACPNLLLSHKRQIALLARLRAMPGVRKAFVASGVRYDMVLSDHDCGQDYIEELLAHHISGQMKVAPEHSDDRVLQAMGKPGIKPLLSFKKAFDETNKRLSKKQFLTYYFIAAHPGCGIEEMKSLRNFASRELHLLPEQVQIFTPTPSTYSSLMYYTGRDPFSGEALYVEREMGKKIKQKEIMAQRSDQ